jgi:DNA-binding LacI/PurR family transcriptional regulator
MSNRDKLELFLGNKVPGSYIVMFSEETTHECMRQVVTSTPPPGLFFYNFIKAVKCMCFLTVQTFNLWAEMGIGTLDDDMLSNFLREERVKYICEDGYMNLQETPPQ